jgi:superfamily II DNA/RNA helicase
MTTFADLGVDSDLCAALAERGINEPFAIQNLTIADALAGRDVCGKAKTGSGKTLAFGLPLVQLVQPANDRKPRALILVPTRELALQVRDELLPLGAVRNIRVAAIYGGAKFETQAAEVAEGIELVIATPGRLIDMIERNEIFLDEVTQVVLDEADRMADMGFLPQVEWLLRHIPGTYQTLLFSATLDGVVDTLIKRYQTDPAMHEVVSEQVTVEQMQHRFLQVHEMDKAKVAATIIRNSNKAIVFVRTKRAADRVAEQLQKEKVSAAPIHGDLRQSARERALSDFAEGKLSALVATDVAARGIHVDDVDVVIHYDPAEDHKSYLHRSGRTARAGANGVVVTLVLWNEELEVRRMQKRLKIDQPIVEVFSNDSRLADLAAWDPSADTAAAS